jgi:hypothetical protein
MNKNHLPVKNDFIFDQSLFVANMSSSPSKLNGLISELSRAFLATTLPIVVEFLKKNPEFLEGETNFDEFLPQLERFSTEECADEEKKPVSARTSRAKVEKAVSSLTAGKKPPGEKTKKGASSSHVWMEVGEFLDMVKRAEAEGSETYYCAYSPPRGQNKEKMCGRIAVHYDGDGGFAAYRCEECKKKRGSGVTVIARQNADSTKSSAVGKKSVPGVNSRKKPAASRAPPKSRTVADEDEEVEVVANKSLSGKIGGDYLILSSAPKGCIVNQSEMTVYGLPPVGKDIGEETVITSKLLKTYRDPTKTDAEAVETLKSYGLKLKPISELLAIYAAAEAEEDGEEEEEEPRKPPVKDPRKKEPPSQKKANTSKTSDEESEPEVKPAKRTPTKRGGAKASTPPKVEATKRPPIRQNKAKSVSSDSESDSEIPAKRPNRRPEAAPEPKATATYELAEELDDVAADPLVAKDENEID